MHQIILKLSNVAPPVLKQQIPSSILNIILVLPFVVFTILPQESAEALDPILKELSLIRVPIVPCDLPPAMLHSILKPAIILRISIFLFAKSISLVIAPLSFIYSRFIKFNIFPIPMHFSLTQLSLIIIAIRKDKSPLPKHFIINPISFKDIKIRPKQLPLPTSHPIYHLSIKHNTILQLNRPLNISIYIFLPFKCLKYFELILK